MTFRKISHVWETNETTLIVIVPPPCPMFRFRSSFYFYFVFLILFFSLRFLYFALSLSIFFYLSKPIIFTSSSLSLIQSLTIIAPSSMFNSLFPSLYLLLFPLFAPTLNGWWWEWGENMTFWRIQILLPSSFLFVNKWKTKTFGRLHVKHHAHFFPFSLSFLMCVCVCLYDQRLKNRSACRNDTQR